MIVLDTHIWIWWVHDDAQLPSNYKSYIQAHELTGLGISIISCWEVAKLVQVGRLTLPIAVREWLDQAMNYPGVRVLELTPDIIVDSTQLPGSFHRDPADQLIVATARGYDCPIVTIDRKIRAYPHVKHEP
jgi:PIN domain nuclease of toxin-antitoxin system